MIESSEVIALCKVFVGTFAALLILRTLFVLRQIQTARRRKHDEQKQHQQHRSPLKTMIVLGSGGHTTEMLRMTQSLDPDYYNPIIYVKASTDTTSVMRLQHKKNNNGKRSLNAPIIYDIPRSREVGQSYASSVISTLYAACYAFALVARIRPKLILTNGPGTCVPLVVAALVGRILGVTASTRTIFVESYCRVETLSLTGKVLFHIADLFVVHWEELHQQYPETTVLVSTFVNNNAR